CRRANTYQRNLAGFQDPRLEDRTHHIERLSDHLVTEAHERDWVTSAPPACRTRKGPDAAAGAPWRVTTSASELLGHRNAEFTSLLRPHHHRSRSRGTSS